MNLVVNPSDKNISMHLNVMPDFKSGRFNPSLLGLVLIFGVSFCVFFADRHIWRQPVAQSSYIDPHCPRLAGLGGTVRGDLLLSLIHIWRRRSRCGRLARLTTLSRPSEGTEETRAGDLRGHET